ncbi:ShlB/FhaC/HecB family hemolysin secretion/activation protein [Noviherbaspirillum aridicola]|uniref:Hemolysin activation/secretion protein n=1 Tax=Noviherbaspirillum aridicola TaxID=2849687 RepID=A0ABQ4Q319_9BURK|nr:ShlB/FhaC/HecB family hemolysin secretion/activation protein [Noviherbaspirillum aridicola]GIZ51426.1 hypothetical protein NCCP691_14400 [Noviherbaspirillum aridicola]
MTIRFRLLAAALAIACAAPAAAQEGVGRFDISGFQVEANTLLEPAVVERLLVPFTGRARDFGDVQMALEALEAEYRRRGYSVVQVALPEQELNDGVVRLRVVETRVGKVRVEGNSAFDEANIRASVPGLREGRSPNLTEVSSSLRLANENPAKKTTLQLQSGAGEDEVDAVLKVADDKPWRMAASVDNAGNRATGEAQLTVQYQHANLGGRDHVMSLQYTTSIENPSDVSVYGVGYHIPLYGIGDSVDLFASYSDVNSASVIAGILNLSVTGKGTVLGARYNQLLARAGDYESRLSYGIDHKDFRNSTRLSFTTPGETARDSRDVTVHPLSIAYTGNWAADGSEVSFGISAARNLPGGDKGGSDDFELARPGADKHYKIVRYNASFGKALPQDWQLRFSLSGQETRDALVPGEQFGAGGATTVRGFDERDASGDTGRLFSAEIYTPNLCGALQQAAAQCRALAFFDTASLHRNKALPGEQRNPSIGSVGLGFRLALGKTLALQLDYGHVVDGGASKSDGDHRVHAKLGISY